MIYVTDARQAQHFAMVFEAASAAGWLNHTHAEHVPFGTMLGEDGTPFKTRSGGTIALADLLDEAVERARTVADEKSPELPEAERAQIARTVGIGAVKYADLSTSRQRDLRFSFERMLALEGNTAPSPALRARAGGGHRPGGGKLQHRPGSHGACGEGARAQARSVCRCDRRRD